MTLQEFQQIFKQLMTTSEGKLALKSSDALAVFWAQSSLSDREKEAMQQPVLEHYRQYAYMLQANVEQTLRSIFSLTAMVLVDVWDEVFEDYDWTPASRSYRLMSVGEAFADYLAGHAVVQERWPYLPDLARYEWVQACLLSYPDTTYPESRLKVMPESEDQLALMVPVLNQASALLELSYPIPSLVSLLKSDPETRLSPDFLSPRSTLVWMYRSFDRPFRCRSFEVSSVLAAWLNSLQSHPNALLSYLDSIQPVYSHIASQMPGLTPGLFYSQFIPMLTQLLENGIVLGSCFIGAVSGEEPL